MRRRSVLTMTMVLSLLLLALTTAFVASATPGTESKSQYCVMESVPITEPPSPEEAERLRQIEAEIGKPIIRVRPGNNTCFDSQQEFEDFLQSRQAPAGSTTNSVTIQASYHLGTLYEHADYNQYQNGRAQAYTSSASCWDYATAYYYVGDYMNDITSSGYTRTDNGCNGGFRFYRHANLVDGPYLCSPNCSYVGDSINDAISSMIIY